MSKNYNDKNITFNWNNADFNNKTQDSRNFNRYEFRKKRFQSLVKLKSNRGSQNGTGPAINEEISIVLGPRPSFYSDPIQPLNETTDHDNEFTRSLDTGGWR